MNKKNKAKFKQMPKRRMEIDIKPKFILFLRNYCNFLATGIVTLLVLIWMTKSQTEQSSSPSISKLTDLPEQCDSYPPKESIAGDTQDVILKSTLEKIGNGQLSSSEIVGYQFTGKPGQNLNFKLNAEEVCLWIINDKNQVLQDTELTEVGRYTVQLATLSNAKKNYTLSMGLEANLSRSLPDSNLSSSSDKKNIIDTPNSSPLLPTLSTLPPPSNTNDYSSFLSFTYNSKVQPPFNFNSNLQKIVDDVVTLAKSRNLPTDKLSISLVDLSSSNCCNYAYYNDKELRYPASVVKLFWLVMLHNQYYQQGIYPDQVEQKWREIISKTIKKSDNETSSTILDEISNTQSNSKELSQEELNNWMNQRYLVNYFYKSANYPDLNISQKTFPISNEVTKPIGPDLQIRQIQGKDSPPVRNYLSTNSVARLLYEIAQNQTISVEYSQEIKKLLKRDLRPEIWKQERFNPIGGFLGESLPVKTDFYAKMGWTFSNRNDAAIIASSDGKKRYILVVFADDPAYYQDKEFFPMLSKQVYQKIKSP